MSQPSEGDPERGTPRGRRGPDPELLQVILQFAELVVRIVLAANSGGPGC
jgi:hypothetical protein